MLKDFSTPLPLASSPVQQKLSRSMSDPNISPRRQIIIHEQVHADPSHRTLFRQFSCEELDVVPGTTSLRFSRRVVSEEFYVNFSDDKANKIQAIDYKMPVGPKSAGRAMSRQDRKRHYRNNSNNLEFKRMKLFGNEKEQEKTLSNLYPKIVKLFFWFVFPILVLLFGLLGSQLATYQKKCNATLDINALENILHTHVFGQDKGIKQLVTTLRSLYVAPYGLQTIVMTGATGVGKTYTASLLGEFFPWPHNTHHFVMPMDFELNSGSFYNFPYCGDHLIIMDDLKEDDLENVRSMTNFLSTLVEQKRRIIALFIFKFHKQLADDVSSESVIAKGSAVVSDLMNRGIPSELVAFDTLRREHVAQCIEKALAGNWIPVTSESVTKVMAQVDYGKEGCKRISSKIAVLHDLWIRDA